MLGVIVTYGKWILCNTLIEWGGAVAISGRASDLRSKGRGFEPRP